MHKIPDSVKQDLEGCHIVSQAGTAMLKFSVLDHSLISIKMLHGGDYIENIIHWKDFLGVYTILAERAKEGEMRGVNTLLQQLKHKAYGTVIQPDDPRHWRNQKR